MREIDLATFWHNVRVRRKRAGVSQADIAKKLGIAQPSYNRYEKLESNTLTDDMIEKIASAIGCTKNELIGYSIEHYPKVVQDWMQTQDGFLCIMEAYEKYKKAEALFNKYKGV